MLNRITSKLISKGEKRLGIKLDYTRLIAKTDFRLLLRYNKIFGFLQPNTKVPPLAYHAARLRGALAADCGACVEAEINLAKEVEISTDQIQSLLRGKYESLTPEIAAVARLADAVVRDRLDDPDAREIVRNTWGDAGLIELSYAMNGAALLPGIKRAMGYATACDLELLSIP